MLCKHKKTELWYVSKHDYCIHIVSNISASLSLFFPEAMWLPITSRSVAPCTTECARQAINQQPLNNTSAWQGNDRPALSSLLNNRPRVPRRPGISVYDFYSGIVQDGTTILIPCAQCCSRLPRHDKDWLTPSSIYHKYTRTTGERRHSFGGIGPER